MHVPMKPYSYIVTVLFCTLFATSLIVSSAFIDPFVMGKRFFLYGVTSMLGLWVMTGVIARPISRCIPINSLVFTVIAFVLYFIIRTLTTTHVSFSQADIITPLAIAAVFFLVLITFRQTLQTSEMQYRLIGIIAFCILAVIITQMVASLLQALDITSSYNDNFPMTGETYCRNTN